MASLTQKGSSKLKKKHFKPKYQKAKLFRANEPLVSVFMWGVNHTINELTHVNVPVMLLPDDFKAFSKIKVDNHHFNKESMPSHFKVKEYCPLVFRNLRERFSIDDAEYMNSLTKYQPIEISSPGRSGAKFYESYDHLFIMKTLQSEEVEQMHSLLKQYHPYIVERHGKTLLPQYLGMYRLTVDGAETYIVVMRNIFSNRLKIHKKYDLKGSTVDREASDKEKFTLSREGIIPSTVKPKPSQEKDIPVLKDNDFVKDGCKIYIGPEAKEKILEMLTADSMFLSSMNLMDYSVCLGIHDCEFSEQDAQEKEKVETSDLEGSGGDVGSDEDEDSAGSGIGGAVPTPPDSPPALREDLPFTADMLKSSRDIYATRSPEGAPKKEVYFLALVDVLTHYGMKKRTAQAAKVVKHGTNAEISTVHPEQYAKRLIDFIAKAME
ncbi:phosphatidylinositol 5-phosphate 4-kinase type-2 alpha-like isoform X1 [Argiope bruennichi]|uniref:phosphatidylinositol 5-phosphate 4-kinase type-2 alpha-like isoform X1 n=1 Tax=Argiope bruennichi TaxID=94029 RepID=UPI002494CC29|nr:phosphatidylinositol 5-phosphate 4-kinase type-2 alpha-like isoform X1 [Argiope bruennichi]